MKGNLILLLTAAVWGTGFISQKMGNEILPPMTFNAIRQLMAAVVMMPVMASGLRRSGYFDRKRHTSSQISRRKKRLLAAGLLCGFFMLVGSMAQQIGLVTVSAGKSGFITAVYIVLVPLFSAILGERVKLKSVLCIALAMTGFAVMSLQGGLGGATVGDWLTLLSAACFAAQMVTVNAFVDKDNAMAISVIQMCLVGIFGLAGALVLGDKGGHGLHE